MRCLAVRKKGSREQCKARPILGHTLCGRHAKCKNPMLWSEVNREKDKGVVRIQALVRGWLVRRRLVVHGPGVLCRDSSLANDEELVTMEEKTRLYPFDYFGLYENGKVWWFSFDTLWKWCMSNAIPTNPYTKVPITLEARRRLRSIWSYRQRHKLPLPPETKVHDERMWNIWNLICQIFEDCAFESSGGFDRTSLSNLTPTQYSILFRILRDDLRIALPPTSEMCRKYTEWCNRRIKTITEYPPRTYCLHCAYTLMYMMMRVKDPYTIGFLILSALYRV